MNFFKPVAVFYKTKVNHVKISIRNIIICLDLFKQF